MTNKKKLTLGRAIAKALKKKKLTKQQLADRLAETNNLDNPLDFVERLINDEQRINISLALDLKDFFEGSKSTFWLNCQRDSSQP